jgi:hypothetical protein
MNALFDIEVVGKGIAEAVKDFVGRSLHSRDARIAELEARIKTLETERSEFKYVGIWEEREYARGNHEMTRLALSGHPDRTRLCPLLE